MFALRPLAAVAASLALAGPASAAVVTVSAQFDPSLLSPFDLNEIDISPVTLGLGDTLDLTIDFLGGPVTLGAASDIWFGLLTNESGTWTVNSTLSFTGGTNVVASVGPLSQSNSFVHVGNYFSNASVTIGPGDFSFDSANQLMEVQSTSDGARRFDQAFFFYTTSITGSPGTVPEPATWALVAAGLALAGFAGRRSRPKGVTPAGYSVA